MKLYLLWEQDEHVDLDGSQSDPCLHGVFDSVAAIRRHINGRYFDFVVDPRDLDLAKPEVRYELSSRSGFSRIWYEERQLNEPGQVHIINGEVVLPGDRT